MAMERSSCKWGAEITCKCCCHSWGG